MTSRTALATTLHDPRGRMAPFIRGCAPWIGSRFHAVCAVSTAVTSAETVESIEGMENSAAVRKPQEWERKMGFGRRAAVAMALQSAPDFVLHLDMDRLLHWILSYADELEAILEGEIAAHDFIVIGRSDRAFRTHPRQQREPELATNDALSRALGRRVDVASGCSSFSREVGLAIAGKSVSDDFGSTDTEWPLLAMLEGYEVGYIEAEGLEFETADLHADRISEIGYDAWVEELFDEASLSYREELMRASIEIIDETLGRRGRGAGNATRRGSPGP